MMDYRKAKQMIEKAHCDQRVKHAIHMLIEDSITKKQQIKEAEQLINQMIEIVTSLTNATHGVYQRNAQLLKGMNMDKKESIVSSEQIGEYDEDM